MLWRLRARPAFMPAQQWEKAIRRQIKDNHGFSWIVIAQSGKTKLTRVHADGAKCAKVLPIEWKATNSLLPSRH